MRIHTFFAAQSELVAPEIAEFRKTKSVAYAHIKLKLLKSDEAEHTVPKNICSPSAMRSLLIILCFFC